MSSKHLNWRVIYNTIPAYAAAMPHLVERVVEKAARDIEAHAKTSMGGSSPSAPGSPPAIDTGTLSNSIQSSKVGPGHWKVTVGAEYGIYLEYGTVKMAARPFMAPAVAAVEPQFREAVKQALKSGMAT